MSSIEFHPSFHDVPSATEIEVKVPEDVDDKDEDAGSGGAGCVMEALLWTISVFLCCVTLPFSLIFILQQVQVSSGEFR